MATRRQIPSNQTRGYRQVGSYSITQDNQQVLVDLPRGPHLESAIIRVFGSANLTVAGTAVRNDAASLFLRRADWVLNSNVTLDSLSGSQVTQGYVTRRTRPVNVNPAAATISVQPFESTFILDRALMDMVRPKDSMLKTDVGISNNQLRIQLGALADMFTGTPTINYASGVNMSVYVTDYQEARDSDGNTPAPLYYIKRNGFQQSIAAAGNQQQVKLSTGNRLRMLSLRVLDAATREPNIALLSRVRVVRAGDTRVDMAVVDMLRLNQAAYGLNPMTGQLVIDLAYQGQLTGVRYSEFWPIPSSADTFLLVDTTAACVLDIMTIEGVDLVGG